MVSCKKNNYRRQYRFVWNSSFRKTKLLLQIDYSLQTFITIAWINFVNIFKKAFLAQWLLGQWRWKWVPVSVSRRQLNRYYAINSLNSGSPKRLNLSLPLVRNFTLSVLWILKTLLIISQTKHVLHYEVILRSRQVSKSRF